MPALLIDGELYGETPSEGIEDKITSRIITSDYGRIAEIKCGNVVQLIFDKSTYFTPTETGYVNFGYTENKPAISRVVFPLINDAAQNGTSLFCVIEQSGSIDVYCHADVPTNARGSVTYICE